MAVPTFLRTFAGSESLVSMNKASIRMTGVLPSQRMTNRIDPNTLLADSPSVESCAAVTAIPTTVDDVRQQMRISEKQIDEGKFVTASEAIAHFYKL